MKKTGINEIARALDISPTTASRAISGKGRVSADTKRRVIEYIAGSSLEPNIRPRKAPEKGSGNIVVTVPQDIKVASFYNSQILNEYEPPISCVDFNIKELGVMAAKTLLDMLQGKETARKLTLGYNVILKESTK